MYAGPFVQGVLDPRFCQSAETSKGTKKEMPLALLKGILACFVHRMGPGTLDRTGVAIPITVDIRTFDKAGPVKTVPCKLYGVPTG